MEIRKIILFFGFILLLFSILVYYRGCKEGNVNIVNGYNCEEIIENYYSKNIEKTKINFQNFTIDKQYAIYSCAIDRHPVMFIFAEDIAKNGTLIVPYLKNKLYKTENSWEIDGIVKIFFDMKVQKTYNVTNDKATMKLIKQKIDDPKISQDIGLNLARRTYNKELLHF